MRPVSVRPPRRRRGSPSFHPRFTLLTLCSGTFARNFPGFPDGPIAMAGERFFLLYRFHRL
jgi:hypothetical protein